MCDQIVFRRSRVAQSSSAMQLAREFRNRHAALLQFIDSDATCDSAPWVKTAHVQDLHNSDQIMLQFGPSPGTRSRSLSDRKRLVSSPSIALPQDAACSCIGMPGRRSQIVTSSKNSPLCARQQRCLIFQARRLQKQTRLGLQWAAVGAAVVSSALKARALQIRRTKRCRMSRQCSADRQGCGSARGGRKRRGSCRDRCSHERRCECRIRHRCAVAGTGAAGKACGIGWGKVI